MNEAEELATLDNSSTDQKSSPRAPAAANTPASLPTISESLAPKLPAPVNAFSAAPASVSHYEAHTQPDLIKACQDGDLRAVEQLLTSENINAGALHHAAANNQWRICNLLLKSGALVNQKIEPMDATPLLWACRNGHAYIVKLLIDHGADVHVVDNSGFSALHLAVHSSNVLMVSYILHLELYADQLDIGNRTPLHWAIVQGDHLSVEALLKSGASSNLADGEGTSPLTLAVYTAKSDVIVSLLLEYGADLNGGTIAEIGHDNVLPTAWIKGCQMAGRYPTGLPIRNRFLSTETAKVLTFLAPVIAIPLSLLMPKIVGNVYIGVLLCLVVLYYGRRLVQEYLIPHGWHGSRATIQSTFFSGIFVSVFMCIAVFWSAFVAPVTVHTSPIATGYLVLSIGAITMSYLATMLMDPGKIEPKSIAKRLQAMNDLMDRGIFDSVHLCLHTYVMIPARAKYDAYLDRVVCRFDHYCPWLYNSIGVRNHRTFVVFIAFLGVAMPVVAQQYIVYAREYGASAFAVMLFIVTSIQSIWIYVLLVVQTTQIARAATSNEVSHYDQLWLFQTDPIKAYSSLPRDHPLAPDVLGETSSASSLLKHNHQGSHNTRPKRQGKLWFCCRITGLSQVLDAYNTFQRSRRWNMADHGIARNCLDFWLGGGNLFQPDGASGLINGQPVDYTQLEYPTKNHACEV